jgi:hypothetical protein
MELKYQSTFFKRIRVVLNRLLYKTILLKFLFKFFSFTTRELQMLLIERKLASKAHWISEMSCSIVL